MVAQVSARFGDGRYDFGGLYASVYRIASLVWPHLVWFRLRTHIVGRFGSGLHRNDFCASLDPHARAKFGRVDDTQAAVVVAWHDDDANLELYVVAAAQVCARLPHALSRRVAWFRHINQTGYVADEAVSSVAAPLLKVWPFYVPRDAPRVGWHARPGMDNAVGQWRARLWEALCDDRVHGCMRGCVGFLPTNSVHVFALPGGGGVRKGGQGAPRLPGRWRIAPGRQRVATQKIVDVDAHGKGVREEPLYRPRKEYLSAKGEYDDTRHRRVTAV